MNNHTILENKSKYYCELCNYGCNHNSVFKKHQKSDKHSRHGEKKIFKCDKCDYKTNTSHWNLKMHIMSKHSTIEERSKQKYYCVTCDSIFFSPLFYNNHIKSILHINNSVLNKFNNNEKINNELTSFIDNDIKPNIKLELNTEKIAELKAEIKSELKAEIMLLIKKNIIELFK